MLGSAARSCTDCPDNHAAESPDRHGLKPPGVFELSPGAAVRLAGGPFACWIALVPQRTEVHPPSGSLHGMESRLARVLALGQGAFYLLTGLWAIVHLRSFEAVTGPKTDDWLVRTVGVLVTVIGLVLMLAWRRRRVVPEVGVLAAGSALGLAGIDLVYALGGVISPVYLLDALVELVLAGLWAVARARG
jgi:hypothetical protein